MRSLAKFLLFFVVLGFVSCDLEDSSMEDLEMKDLEKEEYLRMYAPRVYLHSIEDFWPSSVEWSFNFLTRVWREDSKWWLVTKEGLQEPSTLLGYFHGADPRQEDVPVYAFWNEVFPSPGPEKVVDLIYFLYYPYNRGKEVRVPPLPLVPKTVFGSHVGDWEHVTVRLTEQNSEGRTTLAPLRDEDSFFLSAHSGGYCYKWSQVPKVEGHPVVYSAWGSHALYLWPGEHEYAHAIGQPLIDVTDAGTTWDTWNKVECFDYNFDYNFGIKRLGSTEDLPEWLKKDNGDGSRGNEDPASGPITYWGNGKRGNLQGLSGDYYRLEDGPTGPVDKPCFATPRLD